ncbi:MAG TPA: hypothetical protein VGL77_16130 [Armatimonadota bacterium]|jgi:REP element-mobilizing transposase RayT
MIVSRAQYADVLAYLQRRDTRRNPHRLPLERYAWSDGEYFFTLCARRCGEPFRDPALATALLRALLWRKARHGWLLFCYCLMPDHLHFLVQLPDAMRGVRDAGARGEELESILQQVADFKSYTTSQLWWKAGGIGPLWQQSSYDRVIRYNDSIDQAVHYVLQNPMRKGLVEDWKHYPYARLVDAV